MENTDTKVMENCQLVLEEFVNIEELTKEIDCAVARATEAAWQQCKVLLLKEGKYSVSSDIESTLSSIRGFRKALINRLERSCNHGASEIEIAGDEIEKIYRATKTLEGAGFAIKEGA